MEEESVPGRGSRMIDVGGKAETARTARAVGKVRLSPVALTAIVENRIPKGDVLGTARVAGILGAKMTPSLLPLCHPVRLTSVDIRLQTEAPDAVIIEALVKGVDRTGFEMEALTAVTIAALVVYDMTKAIDPGSEIESVRLLEKTGGKSGHWTQS